MKLNCDYCGCKTDKRSLVIVRVILRNLQTIQEMHCIPCDNNEVRIDGGNKEIIERGYGI